MSKIWTFLQDRAPLYDDEREALRVDGRGRTYGRLLDDVASLAAGLTEIGVGPGTRFASVVDSSPAAVDAWLATASIGVIEAPLNVNYRGRLLANLLQDCDAEFVLCDERHLPAVRDALALTELAPRLIVNGTAPAGALALADLYRDGSQWSPTEMDADEGRVILYTSGTTGPSKGVVHNQAGCLALASYVAEVCGYGTDDRLLNVFPLYHQNARYTGLLTALAAGASFDLESRFSASRFWALCRERGITAFNYLGSVLTIIAATSVSAPPPADHGVRVGWGAGATEVNRVQFQELFGIDLIEVYGLSEAPMATVNLPGSGCAPGSAGRSGRFFEIRVVDAEGRDRPAGEPGEIVLRPKVPDVFTRGYFRNDAATVAATADLWFRSGDQGYLNESGDLFFVDRVKDALRRKGENISAFEVESVIAAHPDVQDVAVYGVAAGSGEDEVVAALVLTRAVADPTAIIRDVASDLPRYAVPQYIRVLDDLPRTPTLKVQKAVLRSQGLSADHITIKES
ncbi:AMP-binding protein [Nocardioides carbamazepini]|uniref:AMP-binding protein n=1 Tax=Nocardioides carbamazepini TaxID=2854259 RepID=UPI00214A3591|nr:AMP-binding protein [Nocardioides carbamazepini]MCR1785069.1 AMP-binding protein [Nocardioides carbamazepini]